MKKENHKIQGMLFGLLLLVILGSSCGYSELPGDSPVLLDPAASEQESTMVEPENPLSAYTYHIDELDVDLEIPENMYAYQINGVYRDWTGNINIHDFST